MANVKLTLESEWAKETLKEVSSLFSRIAPETFCQRSSIRLSRFLKSPGDMFVFDSKRWLVSHKVPIFAAFVLGIQGLRPRLSVQADFCH